MTDVVFSLHLVLCHMLSELQQSWGSPAYRNAWWANALSLLKLATNCSWLWLTHHWRTQDEHYQLVCSSAMLEPAYLLSPACLTWAGVVPIWVACSWSWRGFTANVYFHLNGYFSFPWTSWLTLWVHGLVLWSGFWDSIYCGTSLAATTGTWIGSMLLPTSWPNYLEWEVFSGCLFEGMMSRRSTGRTVCSSFVELGPWTHTFDYELNSN